VPVPMSLSGGYEVVPMQNVHLNLSGEQRYVLMAKMMAH